MKVKLAVFALFVCSLLAGCGSKEAPPAAPPTLPPVPERPANQGTAEAQRYEQLRNGTGNTSN